MHLFSFIPRSFTWWNAGNLSSVSALYRLLPAGGCVTAKVLCWGLTAYFSPENGGSRFLRNRVHLPNYTAPYRGRVQNFVVAIKYHSTADVQLVGLNTTVSLLHGIGRSIYFGWLTLTNTQTNVTVVLIVEVKNDLTEGFLNLPHSFSDSAVELQGLWLTRTDKTVKNSGIRFQCVRRYFCEEIATHREYDINRKTHSVTEGDAI
jgi:hypothetical protein